MGEATENGGIDRRSFLRRAGVAGVFAVPLITTFGMVGMDNAFGAEPDSHGQFSNQPKEHHHHGNQHHHHHGNQHHHHSVKGNQHI